ncbi:MAG TPA: hydrogenase maturation protease [Anaerolineales bacterium]|nr:hydrogenase maturation protease [Anaerolineales bacterium]
MSDPSAHISPPEGWRRGEEAGPGRTLVLGLGNPLRGDDGVGPAVLEAMQASGKVPPTATLWPAHEGDLLDALVAEAWSQLVIIDAAEIGSAPGSWARLEGYRALATSARSGSHRLSLIDALGVARALGKDPAAVSVFAVQPASTGWMPGLSRPVAEAVDALSATVLEMLEAGGRLA